MVRPQVTVLMPVRDCEPWLEEAVASVLGQSLRDLELLVIDDGSTDRSPEILRGVRDGRVRVHRHDRSLGIIASLNEGLDLATGAYVARMDGDDVALPHRLARQVAYLDAHPDVAVLGGEVATFGTTRRTWRLPHDPAAVRARLLFSNTVAHAAVMLRLATLRALGLRYDPAYPHAEDYALWVAVAERAKVANLPDRLLRFRVHPGSISHVKRDAQRAVARRIRREQLERLGLAPSEADLDLHDALAEGTPPGTLEFLDRADAWLQALRRAGRRLGPEVSTAIDVETAFRWGRICRRSGGLGLAAARRFRASPLHGETPVLTRAEVLLGAAAGALRGRRRG